MSSNNLWATGAFADSLETFIETLPEETQGKIRHQNRWKMVLLVCLDSRLREGFLKTLSISQLNSLRLLLLWKSKLFHGPAASVADSNIASQCTSATSQLSTDELTVAMERLGQDFEQDRLSLSVAGLYDSDDESISSDDPVGGPANFFDGTFEPLQYGETRLGANDFADNNLTALQDLRNQAASILFYRRLLTAYMASCNITQFQNQRPHRGYLALEQVIQEEAGLGTLGCAVESCPWLDTKSKTGVPWYLWDLQEGRTIETKDILEAGRPRYAVVSHTWGRWRTNDVNADMRPQVPWLVPENSKFQVRKLPEYLQLLGSQLKCRYVWFDLLCIPQDRSERARIEIARQAAIFGGAAVAVVWQNDTESWTLLQLTIRWMLLAYLRSDRPPPVYSEGDLDQVDPLIDDEMRNVTDQLASANIPKFIQYLREAKSQTVAEAINISWFSSLWTLQEAFLRPDMILVNRNWEILTIDGHLPIPLDAMVFLSTHFVQRDDSLPRPVAWLVELLMCSNMIAFHTQHPASILSTGCARECKHSRSEAVMSVLGATDWYKEIATGATARSEDESLVLGQYAYEFLNEIRVKYGFVFFSSEYSTYNEYRDAEKEKVPIGTILPFSRKKDWAYVDIKIIAEARVFVTQQPHPSIRTWTLLSDGSVKILKAGIIYATPVTQGDHDFDTMADLEVEFNGPEVGGSNDLTDFKMSLRSWMETVLTDSPKFAIYLSAGRLLRGFVLKEISVQRNISARILAKVADFELALRDDDDGTSIEVVSPPTSSVDWIVY